MARMDDLEYALREADAAGDSESAQQLADAIRAEQSNPTETQKGPEDFSAGMVSGDDNIFGSQKFEEFRMGVGKGMMDVGQGAKDLYLRATDYDGSNADALDRLNAKADEEQANFNRDLGDSGWATAGEMTGEIAATLPLGGIVAGAGRSAAIAGKTGRLAMAEGALAEGITERGGIGDRAGMAAMGAAGGKAGDALMKMAGKGVSKYRASVDPQGIKARHRALEATGDSKIAQAEADGGFTLDRVDAMGEGHMEREALRGTPEYDAMHQRQADDILAKAREVSGPGAAGREGTAQAFREETANNLAEVLSSKRASSEAEVDKFYGDWREAMGDERIPLPGLDDSLNKVLTEEMNVADKATGQVIEEVLGKYGMVGKKTSAILDANGNPIAEGGFTVGEIEKVRQELNAIYTPGLSKTGKRLIEKAKAAVDEHVSLHTGKAGSISDEGVQTLNKGRKATETARIHYETFNDKSFLGKLTKAGVDPNELASNPQATLRKLLHPDNARDLKKLKGMLALGTKAEQKVWKDMGDLVKLEALEAGTKGNTMELNVAAFERGLKGSPEALKDLLGAAEYAKIKKATAAFKLAGTKPAQRGAINTSNTAMTHAKISVGARLAAGSGMLGRVGQLILAVPSVMQLVKGANAKSANLLNVERLANGQMPVEVQEKMLKAMREELAEAYGNPAILENTNALNFLIRSTLREYLDKQTEED